jgi:GAF domain-containing protein
MQSSPSDASGPQPVSRTETVRHFASLAFVARELAAAPDPPALVSVLTRSLVPALGTACSVYALDSGGVLRPVGSTGPSRTAALDRLRDFEAGTEQATSGYARIVLQARPVAVEEVTPAWLKGLAEGSTHLSLLQAVDFKSLVLAPMVARGKATGLLVVGSTGRARQYAPAEQSTIELLATLAASVLAVWDLERREAALHARLDDLVRAARELAHDVNNTLTLPVGSIEIALDRPELGGELREMLAAAASDLAAAEQQIRAFHGLVRGESTSPPGSHSADVSVSHPPRIG